MDNNNLPYALAGTEEAWIIASYPVFSQSDWFLMDKQEIVGKIMKNSGGRLCPEFVRGRVQQIFSERGLT